MADAIIAFLLGEAPLEGKWFGESYDGVAPYWWRRHLRAMQSPSQLPSDDGLIKALEQAQLAIEDAAFGNLVGALNEAHKIITEALSRHKAPLSEIQSNKVSKP